jgi:hypothetical protein
MISLGYSVLINSTDFSFNLVFIPIYMLILTLFSAVIAPRSKYDAEGNRQLLLSLLKSSPLSQKELIKNSKLSKSNVNYAINTLIRNGKVKKAKNLGLDMRSVVYRLNDDNGNL